MITRLIKTTGTGVMKKGSMYMSAEGTLVKVGIEYCLLMSYLLGLSAGHGISDLVVLVWHFGAVLNRIARVHDCIVIKKAETRIV